MSPFFHKYVTVIWIDVPLDFIYHFSQAAFKIFLLHLAFSILFMMCLDMFFFIFILREFSWASWICKLFVFQNILSIF